MSDPIHPNIVRDSDLEWSEMSHADKFASRRKILGAAAGAKQIGCSLYEVEQGKCAFPYHAHSANEEAIYILSGTGTLRLGKTDRKEEQFIVRQGDYIVLPASLNHPHQLINNDAETLRYLCMSTLLDPEVVTYPDSQKVGVLTTKAPDSWPEMRGRGFKLLKDSETLGYFDGE